MTVEIMSNPRLAIGAVALVGLGTMRFFTGKAVGQFVYDLPDTVREDSKEVKNWFQKQ